jgi:hypothetical protein
MVVLAGLDTTPVLTLAGVLLAALVAAGLNIGQSRRDAWLKAWVGARLVVSELADAGAVADQGQKPRAKNEVLTLLPMSTAAWETNREAIAPFIGREIWLAVDEAYAAVGLLNRQQPSSQTKTLTAAQRENFHRAYEKIKASREHLEARTKTKPSVSPRPWRFATWLLWGIAALLVALGLAAVGFNVYHAAPWKTGLAIANDDDVAWSLERHFRGTVAACKTIDASHREFLCTVTTPSASANYAIPLTGRLCTRALPRDASLTTRSTRRLEHLRPRPQGRVAAAARTRSGAPTGCHDKTRVEVAPGGELIGQVMTSREAITHPAAGRDEPTFVVTLYRAFTTKRLKPSS